MSADEDKATVAQRPSPKQQAQEAPTQAARTQTAGEVPSPVSVGSLVGRFVVVREVASGGMGVVYVAFDPTLDRKVALKLLHPEADSRAAARLRFLREAQAMARVESPHVVPVHEVGAHGAHLFVAMAYVEGTTLRGWLDSAPRSWRDVLAAFKKAGRGLAAAHAAGLIHRDFKPSNVLVGADGRIQVTDFGLARVLGGPDAPAPQPPDLIGSAPSGSLSQPLTTAGVVMGTAGYIAPEQLVGKPVDARADQFSFCVALYEALFREKPYPSGDLEIYAGEVLKGQPPTPPPEPSVPPWLIRVVLRGMARDPGARFPSMEALLAALDADPTLIRRRRLVAAAAALGLVVLAAAATGWARSHRAVDRDCEDPRAILAGVWDSRIQEAIGSGFQAATTACAVPSWPRVQEILQQRADEWVLARARVCKEMSSRSGTEETHLRLACLDRKRTAMAALTGVLVEPSNEMVDGAVQAALALPPASSCLEAAGLRRDVDAITNPALLPKANRIRIRLADAQALFDLGMFTSAEKAAGSLTSDAKPEELPGLHSQVAYLQSQAHVALEQDRLARADLLDAFSTALAAGDDAQASKAASELAVLGSGIGGTNPPHWVAVAAALLRRAGDDRGADVELWTARSALALGKGDLAEALKDNRRALDLEKVLFGPMHQDTLRTLENDAWLTLLGGDVSEALTKEKHVVATAEDALGPGHPMLVRYLIHHSAVLARAGDSVQAVRVAERALKMSRSAFGESSGVTARAITTLGFALLSQGELARAKAAFEQATAMDGRSAAAHLGLGRVLLAVGRPKESAAELRKGLFEIESAEVEGFLCDRGAARYDLARALWGLEGEQEHALDEARLARSELGALPFHAAERARADAWLAARESEKASVHGKETRR
jgi:tetratricopeptide (TPR) repeat protein